MDLNSFKILLYNQKINKFQLFGQLKLENDFNNFDKIIRGTITHPLTKSLLLNNPFPRKLNELRAGKMVPYSGNLSGEISWILYSIKNYASELNELLSLKLEFDRKLLINAQEAERILDKIEEKFGYSFWLLENRFLVEELKTGTEANWKKLSDYTKIVTDPYIQFIIENLSKRAESKTSYARFKNVFINQINDIGGFEGFGEFICFKLNYTGFTGYSNFGLYLNTESTSALIDRYLLLRDILTEIFDKKNPEVFEIAQKTIERLYQIGVKDDWLTHIRGLADPSNIQQFTQSASFFKLIDTYTNGLYNQSLADAKALIIEDVLNIEAYEVYCKSLIELGQNFVNPGVSENVDDMIQRLFDVLAKNNESATSRDQLLKTVAAFFSTCWAKQLFSLLSQYTQVNNNSIQIRLTKILHSRINNPRILNYYISDPPKYSIAFEAFQKINASSVSLKLNKAIDKGDVQFITNEIPDTNKRKLYYKAKASYKGKDYVTSADTFREILTKKNSELTNEESLFYFVSSLIRINNLREAAITYVDHFLRNRNIVSRLPLNQLVASIEKSNYAGLEDLIELPILIKIGKHDPYEQYIAYDVFMLNQDYNRPSEMLPAVEKFQKEKMVYFLNEICNPEILHHSFHFEGTEDIENERSILLHELLKLDKDNESVYIKELTEIQQNIKVRNALREVNKGRITVNVTELKNSESETIKEGFNRYLYLYNFSKSKQLVSPDTTNPNTLLDYLLQVTSETTKNKVVYGNDPAFVSFKGLFLDLRDKFLLSKEYGLDGYLSTRIRHGSLLNHIRSVFEKHNLVSQKDANGNYLENPYWNGKGAFFYAPVIGLIQTEIKKFSKQVDEYTEFLIRELIQVKTEKYTKRTNALFDFSLDDKNMAVLFSETRDKILDYRVFLDFVFNFLTEHANLILKNIREKINSKIKNDYLAFLEDFQGVIKRILADQAFPELSSSIVQCSTQIQSELRNISEWFTLSNPGSDLIFDVETIIQTSVEICNSIYPNYKITPVISKDSSVPIYGGIHLIYITKILLDNIVQHSGVPANEQRVEFMCKQVEEEKIQLTVSNSLPKNSDKGALIQRLNEIKDKWLRDRKNFENINIEGGSGFDKIRKILALDMSNQLYDFDFSIAEDTLSISIEFKIRIEEVMDETK